MQNKLESELLANLSTIKRLETEEYICMEDAPSANPDQMETEDPNDFIIADRLHIDDVELLDEQSEEVTANEMNDFESNIVYDVEVYDTDNLQMEADKLESNNNSVNLPLSYYNSEIQRWSFVEPTFGQKAKIPAATRTNTDPNYVQHTTIPSEEIIELSAEEYRNNFLTQNTFPIDNIHNELTLASAAANDKIPEWLNQQNHSFNPAIFPIFSEMSGAVPQYDITPLTMSSSSSYLDKLKHEELYRKIQSGNSIKATRYKKEGPKPLNTIQSHISTKPSIPNQKDESKELKEIHSSMEPHQRKRQEIGLIVTAFHVNLKRKKSNLEVLRILANRHNFSLEEYIKYLNDLHLTITGFKSKEKFVLKDSDNSDLGNIKINTLEHYKIFLIEDGNYILIYDISGEIKEELLIGRYDKSRGYIGSSNQISSSNKIIGNKEEKTQEIAAIIVALYLTKKNHRSKDSYISELAQRRHNLSFDSYLQYLTDTFKLNLKTMDYNSLLFKNEMILEETHLENRNFEIVISDAKSKSEIFKYNSKIGFIEKTVLMQDEKDPEVALQIKPYIPYSFFSGFTINTNQNMDIQKTNENTYG